MSVPYPMYNTVVIYHGNCPDGLASAWAFTQADRGPTHYHYAIIRDFYKDTDMPDLTNKEVYIVDFSYSRKALEHICSIARRVTIFDHHKTSQEDLAEPIPGLTCVFDMNRCGFEITWDCLYGTSRPWWMIHIRDRDLWEWKNPDSDAFSAALSDMGLRFETLDLIDKLDQSGRCALYERGRALIAFTTKEVSMLCKGAELVQFAGHKIYALNSPRYKSETGNVLAQRRDDCDFAAVYNYCLKTDEYYISLRGTRDDVDLADIAKRFGGGGHKLASGFTYKGPLTDIMSYDN